MKPSELLSGPEKWTQGQWAETKDGESVSVNCPDAVRWCLYGAVCYCYPDEDDRVAAAGRIDEVLASDAGPFYQRHNLVTWNDALERRFEDIQRLLQRAGE